MFLFSEGSTARNPACSTRCSYYLLFLLGSSTCSTIKWLSEGGAAAAATAAATATAAVAAATLCLCCDCYTVAAHVRLRGGVVGGEGLDENGEEAAAIHNDLAPLELLATGVRSRVPGWCVCVCVCGEGERAGG